MFISLMMLLDQRCLTIVARWESAVEVDDDHSDGDDDDCDNDNDDLDKNVDVCVTKVNFDY